MAWTLPRVWVAGEVPQSAELNKIAANINFLRGDAAWTAPTMNSPWANYGGAFAPAGYRKKGDRVHLRGLVQGGATASTIFTLPTGYRPDYNVAIQTTSNDLSARVGISSGGVVTFDAGSSGGWVCLDPVAFTATLA